MRTYTYHQTNMGAYAPSEYADAQGYITIHKSPRYRTATDDQLQQWAESPYRAVRAAAATEQAERCLDAWRRR